jgi:molybdopterin-guanine dinucleotide biosynthesis protein A
MGQDKALLVLAGEPMVRRVAVALRDAGASQVVTIGGDQPALAAALGSTDPVVTVPDDSPDQGPLGGILTALRILDTEIVLVVACDLLTPSSSAMTATVAALAASPADDAAAPLRGDQVEWLHAAWRRRARPLLAAQFAAGERSVHAATRGAGLALLTVSGLEPAALADADAPADLPPTG